MKNVPIKCSVDHFTNIKWYISLNVALNQEHRSHAISITFYICMKVCTAGEKAAVDAILLCCFVSFKKYILE